MTPSSTVLKALILTCVFNFSEEKNENNTLFTVTKEKLMVGLSFPLASANITGKEREAGRGEKGSAFLII